MRIAHRGYFFLEIPFQTTIATFFLQKKRKIPLQSLFCKSLVFLNIILSLSLFPVARALHGREKLLLYLTPLLITATLPRLYTTEGSWIWLAANLVATASLLGAAILLFYRGLKRFSVGSYISLNE